MSMWKRVEGFASPALTADTASESARSICRSDKSLIRSKLFSEILENREDIASLFYESNELIKLSLTGNGSATAEFLLCGGANPVTCGQINLAACCALLIDRCKEDFRAIQILILQGVADRILGIIKEHGTHDRSACFGVDIHIFAGVVHKALTKFDQTLENRIICFAEGPDLVISAAWLDNAGILFHKVGLLLAGAM